MASTVQYHKHLRHKLNDIQRDLYLGEDHEYTNGAPNHYLVQFHSLTGYYLKKIEQFADVLVIELITGNLGLHIEVKLDNR